MVMFFRRENKQPLNFSYIQERKQKQNYLGWFIGIPLLVIILSSLYLLLHPNVQ